MMRIYTRLVMDMTTSAVVEAEGFDYDGPVAWCGGKSAAPRPRINNPDIEQQKKDNRNRLREQEQELAKMQAETEKMKNAPPPMPEKTPQQTKGATDRYKEQTQNRTGVRRMLVTGGQGLGQKAQTEKKRLLGE